MKFVLPSNTNKGKSTEVFQPLPLIHAHVHCREPQKSAKGPNFDEDDRALPL